ncbi:cupredoxin domain-containing protein [Candidatus Gracilibacteria bacterium]|nr:cupredoxin domain-containing protein [Candidatus Gracilibacteria bacterium]
MKKSLIVLSLFLAGCSSVSEPVGDPVPELVMDEGVIVVEGSEFSFSPDDISLPAGEVRQILFKNVGRAPHDFVIEGTDIKTSIIAAGGEELIEFTVPENGLYSIYCSVPGHRRSGMEGDFIAQ